MQLIPTRAAFFETAPTTSQLGLQRAQLLHRVAAGWSIIGCEAWSNIRYRSLVLFTTPQLGLDMKSQLGRIYDTACWSTSRRWKFGLIFDAGSLLE